MTDKKNIVDFKKYLNEKEKQDFKPFVKIFYNEKTDMYRFFFAKNITEEEIEYFFRICNFEE